LAGLKAPGVVVVSDEVGESVNNPERCAQSDSNCVDAPAFTGAAVVAGHSPAEPAAWGEEWQADLCTDKPPRITAPRLTTRDRTTPIGADCAVITTHDEAAANGKNVLKCISTIKTHI